MTVERWYLPSGDPGEEFCFYLDLRKELNAKEQKILRWLLSFVPGQMLMTESMFRESAVVEVGPRLNFETPFSSNAVSIFQGCGITKITRCELAVRYLVPKGQHPASYAEGLFDRMTQMVYDRPIESFVVDRAPEAVYTIPVLEHGAKALREESRRYGYGWDDADIEMILRQFLEEENRNPTNVELAQWAQANSNHSRHHGFNAIRVIDGKPLPFSLFQLIKEPWEKNPGKSTIAFSDNASAIRGHEGVFVLVPDRPWEASRFSGMRIAFDPIASYETHNHPTYVSPRQGAETGPGGCLRDKHSAGRGSKALVAVAGYAVAHLRIPGYTLPWEIPAEYPDSGASALHILNHGSDGATEFEDKFGDPVIQGVRCSYEIVLPDGTRWGFVKPILFTGGIGRIRAEHRKKGEPSAGDFIVMIGGPAYRIGFGGGSASSQMGGENRAELDFDSVQRGNAQMLQRAFRAIEACIALGSKNPILAIHDQGAGGPCNVLTELVHPAGGKIEIRRINLGDPTLPVVAIWIAEYQERYGLLVRGEEDLVMLRKICEREGVPIEVLGQVTGNGRIVVTDECDGSTPVNMNLASMLGNLPKKIMPDTRVPMNLRPFVPPEGVTVINVLERVLRLASVGSKEDLTDKGDRSVGGLVAQQQCCGPRQLPVSDVAVTALSHFDTRGAAMATGVCPLSMIVNPQAGARMALAEALTNLVWAGGVKLEKVQFHANWMWPDKLPGEGVAYYDAVAAVSQALLVTKTRAVGGKDSSSMAARLRKEVIKSPRTVVMSAYVDVPDVRNVMTPDLKRPGRSTLLFLDLARGKTRLGGSAFAYVYGELGDECPDVEDWDLFDRAFRKVQDLIARGLILAGHDRSDGGLITTVLEMAFSGVCGLDLNVRAKGEAIQFLFTEEAGLVIEVANEDVDVVCQALAVENIPHTKLGRTTSNPRVARIVFNGRDVLDADPDDLLFAWRETSHRLRALQVNPECAAAEEEETRRYWPGTSYYVPPTFVIPEVSMPPLDANDSAPSVAVVREEGTNGDQEMVSALALAGFRVYDVTMSDLLADRADIRRYQGVVFPGGFSYADTLGSARGWAAKILFHDRLSEMFAEFYRNPDTFSFGVCNGCQLMAQLGWVPKNGIAYDRQPIFTHNHSRKFESRWSTVKIFPSTSIMLRGMEEARLGVWVAHGEGRLVFPDDEIRLHTMSQGLAPIRYVDDAGAVTNRYPWNPNGSPEGIAALCSENGRHLAMMPHPERAFLMWQWPWVPDGMKDLPYAPWLKLFTNAYEWCKRHSS